MNPLLPVCSCPRHKPQPRKDLTELRLQLLQREMFQRPYDVLTLDRNVLKEKLKILNLYQRDIDLITTFITKHSINQLEIKYYSFQDLHVRSLMESLDNLNVLHLVAVDLETSSMKTLAENAENFKLQTLNLSENNLTEEHVTYLHQFLITNQTLQYLDVGYCGLTIDTFVLVADGVYNSKSIISINLSRIVSRHEFEIIDTTKIGSIMGVLLSQNKLKEFRLRNCGLTGHDIEPIIEYVGLPNVLTRLDLAANNIGWYGAEKLMNAISKGVNCGNQLWALDISSNNLRESGGNAVATLIGVTKIRYLNISFNQIPANEINVLLETARKPYDLKVLKIWGNYFNEDSADFVNRYVQGTEIISNVIDVAVTYDCGKEKLIVIPFPSKISFPKSCSDLKNTKKRKQASFQHAKVIDKTLCKEPALRKLTKHEEFSCQMNALKSTYL